MQIPLCLECLSQSRPLCLASWGTLAGGTSGYGAPWLVVQEAALGPICSDGVSSIDLLFFGCLLVAMWPYWYMHSTCVVGGVVDVA